MRHVGLVIKSRAILSQITALHIWGKDTGFEISFVCSDLLSMQNCIENDPPDLLIVETVLAKQENYLILQEIVDKGLCQYIAFCGLEGDFHSARKAIQLGVSEYFTLPLSEVEIKDFFDKIRLTHAAAQGSIEENIQNLYNLFSQREDSIYSYLEKLCQWDIVFSVIDGAIEMIFEKHEWLDLYVNKNDYTYSQNENALEYQKKFRDLFKKYISLNPQHNETLDKIVVYILYNPESDLRQKTLADELHINKSYLSTVFTVQTGIRYIDYVSYVKLMRAAWLLKNTNFKINEIAMRIYYKDIAYFSKQFKKIFNITPSEYRIPDEYQFEI